MDQHGPGQSWALLEGSCCDAHAAGAGRLAKLLVTSPVLNRTVICLEEPVRGWQVSHR